MRCNNINNINKEAPMTCKIRINQPLFMFIIIVNRADIGVGADIAFRNIKVITRK